MLHFFLLLMNINVLCTSKKLAKIKEIEKRVDERSDQSPWKNPHRGRSRASSITRLAGRLRRRPVAGGQEEDGRRREIAPN
jgi:hypothetical protein